MPDFTSILNKRPSEIKEPPLTPVGTYLCLLQGQPVLGESSGKKTPQVDFPCKVLAAGDDVNKDELAAIGGIANIQMKNRGGLRFYLSEDAQFMVKNFLIEHCAIPATNDDGSEKLLKQLFAEAPGKQVYVVVRHETTQDGKRVVASVASTMRV